jgi:hypothetical protein
VSSAHAVCLLTQNYRARAQSRQDVLQVLGGLVRISSSISPNSSVQFQLLRQVDTASGGKLFRGWVERDFIDRSSSLGNEHHGVTLEIADTILDAAVDHGSLSTEARSGSSSSSSSPSGSVRAHEAGK